MNRRQQPGYRREPYPTVVSVLLDHDLLAEGGTASLRLAARVVDVEESADTDRAVDAVARQLLAEQLTPDEEFARVVAQDVVDALVDWRAPADGTAAPGEGES